MRKNTLLTVASQLNETENKEIENKVERYLLNLKKAKINAKIVEDLLS